MKDSRSSVRNAISTSASAYDRINFLIISAVHDGFYRLFVNPYVLLYAAGIRAGQKVLEVGCGPGFFTVPAAKIVGEEGSICALDINPVAVEAVRRKTKQNGLNNVKVMLADARETGLPDSSFDVAFLFGVIHDFPDVSAVMREMHRVLKTKGLLSAQKSFQSETTLLNVVIRDGIFSFEGKTHDVYRFSKIGKGEKSRRRGQTKPR